MENKKIAAEERRKHQRYPIFASASIRINNKDDISTEGMVVSVSQLGLGFYTYVPIAKGTPVSMEIKFVALNGTEQKDCLEGKIIYTSKIGSLYYSGIVFNEELNPDKQPHLYEHFWKVIRWR